MQVECLQVSGLRIETCKDVCTQKICAFWFWDGLVESVEHGGIPALLKECHAPGIGHVQVYYSSVPFRKLKPVLINNTYANPEAEIGEKLANPARDPREGIKLAKEYDLVQKEMDVTLAEWEGLQVWN